MKVSYIKAEDTKLKYIVSLSDEDIEVIKEGGDVTSYSILNPNDCIMVCKEGEFE